MHAARRVSSRVWFRLVLCAALLGSLAACKTATVEMKDGSQVVGKISESNATTITLTDEDGEEQKVERADVVAIEHPGVAEMITGGTMTAVGLGLLIPGGILFTETEEVPDIGVCTNRVCQDVGDEKEVAAIALLVSGTIFTFAGLGTGISGVVIWTQSRSKASFEGPEARLEIAPTTVTDGQSVYQGAALSLTW